MAGSGDVPPLVEDRLRAVCLGLPGVYEELAWTVNISTNHAPIAADIELLAGDFSKAERLVGESCRKLKAWGLRAQLATNDHAPESYRIATVRNLDAWYDAFDVQPGQRLYLEPKERVRIW